MTTITVAHRVKTIMNSDMIYVYSYQFGTDGGQDKGQLGQLVQILQVKKKAKKISSNFEK